MQHVRHYPRPVLMLGALGLIGLGLACALGGVPGAAGGEDKKEKGATAGKISPPPADVNDLSMEVAALRTLYLFKRSGGGLESIKTFPSRCAQKPRKREKADVSEEYHKVLIDLRAAYIAWQEDRIFELSDQLEELAEDEEPELDDAVEVTDAARKSAPYLLNNFTPPNVAAYLAAYGKDFPDPWGLMYKTMRLNPRRGQKPTPEKWKEIRAFVIQEVSWNVGGLDKDAQKRVGAQVAALLDRAYPLGNDQLEKEGRFGSGLRGEISKIMGHAGSMGILAHVVERDLAEWMSNPRALPAIEARLQYLKK